MKKLHELSNLQKQFAEEHINLVYWFLHFKTLPVDEYYDIVIFGYLAAVQEYEEHSELAKYSFTTIAWKQMDNCLCEYYTYLNRPKRKAVTVSIQSEETLSLDELLPNRRQNLQDSFVNHTYVLELLSYMTHKEQEVVILKASGFTYSEIAKKCGISYYGVNSRFARMRQRLNLILSA